MPQAIGLYIATAALQAGATVGAAAAITTVTSALVSVGLSVGLSYLAALFGEKPRSPKPSDVKTNIREATQPRMRSYGVVRVGGTMAYIGSAGDYLVKVLCLGQGRIARVVQHYVDDQEVTIDGDGFVTSGPMAGNDSCRIRFRLGDEIQSRYGEVQNLVGSSIWSDAHRGNGMPTAAMMLRQAKPEDFSSTFPNGANTSYSQVQESAIVFDPRIGSNAFSENAALCIRDFLISRWGLRLSADTVTGAADAWAAQADICDEALLLKEGGTDKRYRIGMTYTMAERPADVLQRMLDACDGLIFPTPEGGLALKVGRWEEPTVTLDEGVITGVTGLTRGGDVLTRFNTIRAQYTSGPHKFEEVDADPWVNEELVSLYGEASKDVQIYAVPSHSQARRLMKILDRRLNPRWRMTLACNLGGLAVLGERFVRVVLPDYGIDESFEIQGQPAFVMGEENTIVGLQMELVAMDASAYAWNAAAEEGTAPPVPDSDDALSVMPIPTGLAVAKLAEALAGQPITSMVLSADAPARSDHGLLYELSDDGGTVWRDVPHGRDEPTAKFSPLLDGIVYLVRARTVSFFGRKSDPTTPPLVATADVATPLTPMAFTAAASGSTVTFSARVADDVNTKRLQFRRGTASQTFAAAAIVSQQIASAGDVRSGMDTPGVGTWKYWATAENYAGGLADNPAAPVTVTVTA